MTLRDLLHIDLPIIQAPMAGVQDSALAIAVSNSGGLGSLPCAMLTADALHKQLSAIRAQTSKPFNVNFFCHTQPKPDAAKDAAWRTRLAPYHAELGIHLEQGSPGPARLPFSQDSVDVLAPFRPPVVSFHFGLPAPELLDQIRSWGAKVLSSATTVAEARWLERQGVDAIIAQGIEAGGHRGMFLSDDVSGQVGTLALVPQVVDAVTVPVIAAGGIADARGVAAVMALGASGVQVGTAYLLCPESRASAVHRAALVSDQAGVTAITNVFTGRPARGIVNRIVRELGPMSDAVPAFPLAAPALAPLRSEAERRGSGDFSALWAGQNVSGCKEVSAATLTRELASELRRRLHQS